MKKYLSVKNIARIGVIGALGAVLMMFDFPIFIAPSFYKFDIGDLPCLIASFAMGPIPAVFIQVIKIIMKLIIKPTSSAFVGEISAFITSVSYCVTAAYIYNKDKSKRGGIKAIIIASIVMVLVSSLANYFYIIPAYVNLYHMPLEAIIAAGSAIFPVIHDLLSFVLCCVVPFNLIKAIILDILTLSLYKRVSPLLKG